MLISNVIDMDRPEKQRQIPEVESLCGEPLKSGCTETAEERNGKISLFSPVNPPPSDSSDAADWHGLSPALAWEQPQLRNPEGVGVIRFGPMST